MKSIPRILLCHLTVALAAILITPITHGAENPFTSIWPFSKPKQSTPTFTKSFSPSKKSAGSSLLEGPSRLKEKAGKQTNSLVKKTKNGWRELQGFGRSMNPFSKPKQNKKKKSLLDTVFPKQPVDDGPATVGEFLTQKRPGF